MKRKMIAWIMLCVLTINTLSVWAQLPDRNTQDPAREFVVESVRHSRSTVTDNILPIINTEWKRPDIPSDVSINDAYYQFKVIDLLFGEEVYWSERIDYDDSKEEVEQDAASLDYGANEYGQVGNNRYNLESGKLYNISIIPKHIQRFLDADGYPDHWVIESRGPDDDFYVLTDLNTIMYSRDNALVIRWEYVPGGTYEMHYIAANRDTKADIIQKDNPESRMVTLADEDVQDLLVVDRGVTYVEYPMSDTTPGQIYSAYVEVVDIIHPLAPADFEGRVKRNDQTNENGPKVVKGIPAVDLDIKEIDGNMIRISWDNTSWGTIESAINQVTLYAREQGQEVPEVKVVRPVTSTNPVSAPFIIEKPSVATEYRVDFRYQLDVDEPSFSISSNTAWYVPDIIQERPLKPQVPKPWGPNVDFSVEDRLDYLVTGDTIPANHPDFVDHTFHVKMEDDGTSIQFIWDLPFEDGEPDYGLYYDIWISDSYGAIAEENGIPPVIEDFRVIMGQNENIIYDHIYGQPIGIKVTLEEYIKYSGGSFGELQPIITNNTYYIKIQAKRKYPNNELTSLPEIVALTIDKSGDIFAPPVIGKPPLQIEDVTTDEITFKWLEEWYEILPKNPSNYIGDSDEKLLAEIGSSRIYLDDIGRPHIRYKYEEGFEEKVILDEDDVKDVIAHLEGLPGNSGYYEENYFDRMMSLGNGIQYDMNILPYKEVEDEIEAVGGINHWVLREGIYDLAGWRNINPTAYTDEKGREWKEYTAGSLEPNTQYIILLSAYRELDDGSTPRQMFPAYLIATTESDHEGEEPIPTVPNLQLHDVTDTRIAVWWEYNDDFLYEVVYDTKDDPDAAKVWTFDLEEGREEGNYITADGKAIVTIKGLFPETSYNVWIRAKQRQGDKVSEWSNPVHAKTKELETPEVPTGLGAASRQTMVELGRAEDPVGENHITVEWMLNRDDIGDREEESLKIRYEYDLMFADNMEFLDAVTVTVSESEIGSSTNRYEILSKQVVQFSELRANYPHYVKIRARVILEDTNSDRELSKESEYSSWVRILTDTSDGEYDGGNNSNIVIYPDDIEENLKDGVWTWEIVNANGIITQILKDNKYYLDVPVEKYAGRYSANTRLIRIPMSVMSALSNQNMTIRVFTDVGKYEIEPKAINYYLEGVNSTDIVEIQIDQLRLSDMLGSSKDYPYMYQKGEKLSFTVDSPDKIYMPLPRLDAPIKVGLKVDNPYNIGNVQSYLLNQSTGAWEYRTHTMEQIENTAYLSYTTYDLGVYSLYTVNDYVVSTTTYEMKQIKERYNVLGLGNKYDRYSTVHSDQYILLLLGIAQDYSEINLDAYVGESINNQANYSGIYTDQSGYITEEQALSGLVRLYEMKTGYEIKTNAPVNTNVSSKYRSNIQKAYTIGIGQNINPKAKITYAQLCSWLVEIGF